MAHHVKVLIRCRPLLEHEKATHRSTQLDWEPTCVRVRASNSTDKVFTFDKVLWTEAVQQDVFDEVEPLVDHALDGLHATVFAYGQTGSGKTHTMEGFDYAMSEGGKLKPVLSCSRDQHGVVLRSIESVFEKTAERMMNNPHIKYRVQCSYMQLYNEKVYDLLNSNATLKASEKRKSDGGLRVRWGKNDQFFVENLFVFECDTAEQVRDLFQMGVKNKSMGSHQMNLASSRSHSIFTMYINSWDPASPDCVIKSEFALVDLAGSEKLALLAKNPSQKLLQESIDINTSLLALGKVIQALASDSKTTHVPYRDSKLTKLLKHSLGGNSMTMMIACINPSDSYVEETLCTLFYAGRARNIRNDPRVNEDPKSALIRALKQEIESLKLELNNYRQLLLEEGGVLGAGRSARAMASPSGTATLSGEVPTDKEAQFLGEKLVNSVRIMRELVTVNGQLRTNFDKMNEMKVQAEQAVAQLNEENVELRERIEMLESIVIRQADDDDTSEPSSTTRKPAEPTGQSGESRHRSPAARHEKQRKALSQYQQRYKRPPQLPDYHQYYGSVPRATGSGTGSAKRSQTQPPAPGPGGPGGSGAAAAQALAQQQLQEQLRQQQYQQQQQYLQQAQQYQQQMQQQYALQQKQQAALSAQSAAAAWLQQQQAQQQQASQQAAAAIAATKQQQQLAQQQWMAWAASQYQQQGLPQQRQPPAQGGPQHTSPVYTQQQQQQAPTQTRPSALPSIPGRPAVAGSPARPASDPAPSTRATTNAAGFLSAEEYRQYFTPEQMAVLQRRGLAANPS
eukprot:TRINITY_DN7266_c0_g1_i1.p1 TRINITY_DN7266_c0_g1~~TRINITY_DN7266_c0_g1_i1.p1  ORF type:complete len:794 (-),score=173.54 TRINITY_DN7266_c0_g1_i1:11-2392(-)